MYLVWRGQYWQVINYVVYYFEGGGVGVDDNFGLQFGYWYV